MHTLSRLIGRLANSKIKWLKNFLINLAIKHYKIDMSLAAEPNPENYNCFNDFFTRALKPEVRPIVSEANAVACPVDGKISQIGQLDGATMLQAKGFDFDLNALFGKVYSEYSSKFLHGLFTTLYLSPRDYHRIHSPVDCKLLAMIHIPGKLFSVSPKVVSKTPNLYARNERVVIVFETPVGLMTVVLVGAALVASIVTTWAGVVTPPTGKKVQTWNYANDNITFKRGEEIGRFQFGSTVILIFEPNTINWDSNLTIESTVQMGEKIAIAKNFYSK
jgi:phosphatidylserine decarboxylase